MNLGDLDLKQFLDELGSDKATPGGGAVAALTGANAAGLVGMVARLSLHHAETVAQLPTLTATITLADRLREELRLAIDGDATAFSHLMATYKLPKTSEAEKQTRSAAIQNGLKAATESPLNIARKCYTLIELAQELAQSGTVHIVSDAAAAALLAEAALRSALLQARINLKSLKDIEYVSQARLEIAQLEQQAQSRRDLAFAVTLDKLNPQPKA